VALRRLLRRDGPDEELVEALHVILEVQTQKRLPALIHHRSVVNEQVVRVVDVDIGPREPVKAEADEP